METMQKREEKKLAVGGLVDMGGFFTKALYLRGVSAAELERRLGYHPGRLKDGWWLLFMETVPSMMEFRFKGYSQMSGGVAQGHLPGRANGSDAQDRLYNQGMDVDRLKQKVIRDTFTVIGANRLAKVVPVMRQGTYPAGTGIPQWELERGVEKPFHVAAFIGPAGVYSGDYSVPRKK